MSRQGQTGADQAKGGREGNTGLNGKVKMDYTGTMKAKMDKKSVACRMARSVLALAVWLGAGKAEARYIYPIREGLTDYVSFDANGGTCAVSAKEYTAWSSTTFGTLPAAEWAGHAFLGWWTAATGGTAVSASDKVFEDGGTGSAGIITYREYFTRWPTLYAHWTSEQVVSFDAAGGECGETERRYAIGTPYGEFPAARKQGEVLAGWYTATEGGERVTEDSTVTAEAERTLHARWTTEQTVTFDANGGSCAVATARFAMGAWYNTLPTATWAGHVFLGWWTAAEGGMRVYENSTVDATAWRTLYAHWTAEQTVTFNANGGSCAVSTGVYTMGKAYGNLPVARRSGQGFAGWWTRITGGTRIRETDIVETVVARSLYAHWTTVQTVRFDAAGGKSTVTVTNRPIGGTYGELPTATWAGHAFLGWWTAASGGVAVSAGDRVTEESERTFHARWTAEQRVKFEAHGGTCAAAEKTYAIGAAYGAFPAVEWANHLFLGWWTEAAGGSRVYETSTVGTVAARTLHAHWASEQTVTFDANGGSCATATLTRSFGGTYGELPVATWAGHAFLGWWTAQTGGSQVTAATKVSEATGRRLYAHWTAVQTVSFLPNGGSVASASAQYAIGGKYGTLPTATWANHAFLGWWTQSSGGTKVEAGNTVEAVASRTLYAHWTTGQTVTLDANGGTCPVATLTRTIGGTYGELPAATWAWHSFDGWWTAASGGTRVVPSMAVDASPSRRFYAHWTHEPLRLGAERRSFGAEGGKSKELGVAAEKAWTAKAGTAWITVKTGKGAAGNGKLVYDVAANTGAARTGTITVSSGGATARFTVEQATGIVETQLELDAESRSFTAAAAKSKELGVKANVAWTAKGSADWITVRTASGKGNGKVVYDVAENPGTAARTGAITVSGGGVARMFTVTQGGSTAALSLGASSRTFTAAAAAGKELGVTANVAWTAESSVPWVTLQTKSGTGNGKIVFSVAANTGTSARTGTITVSGGGKTATCTITQEKNEVKLEVSPANREFTCAAAGGKELGVTANVAWTAKSSVSWIKLSKASGSGNGKVAFSVAENPDSKSRTGKITVSGGGKTATCTILQAEKIVKLGISPAERSFGPGVQDGKEASVTANVKWTAKSSASWLKLTKSSGNGNGKVAYTLAANKAESGRSATITVSGGGKTAKCTIRQDKMVVALSISPESRSFSHSAQDGKEASVKANVKWTAKSSASWLQLSKSSGNGNGKVAYSLKANNSSSDRSATIKVTGGGKTATCTIRQAAKKPNLRFYRPRGWPAAVFVTTDERSLSTRTTFTANTNPVVCIRWAWDNNGEAVAPSHTVRFKVTGPDSCEKLFSSASLDTQHYRCSHLYYGKVDLLGGAYAAPSKDGVYTATVTLDPWDEVAEKNESDNTASVTFTVVHNGLNTGPAAPHDGGSSVDHDWALLGLDGAERDEEGEKGAKKGVAERNVVSETAEEVSAEATDGRARDGGSDDEGWVVVTTSDQIDGGVLLDGDEGTGWGPVGEGGGWVVLSYSEPIDVKGVAVKGEGLPEEGVRVLLSEDADEWLEGTEGRARYVWVLLPEEAAGATVTEIEVEEAE